MNTKASDLGKFWAEVHEALTTAGISTQEATAIVVALIAANKGGA